ncbi:MAG: 16S rRNA (cytosine(1402)-N(4))-methyltransferase RsmH [Lactobacillaceae bacterium]|jgi:16S rRNA (cytosine1402-N4)-methyltransferase|nr:16S rRNA (cytosine(1402)-N(4))-methyltransferase RsmH [Lactobacillaceae bacterium]
MVEKQKHFPVMLKEVLQSLDIKDGKTYVDCTFGNGGYSEAILKSADCKVYAVDRDPNVISRANELKKAYGGRFNFILGRFGDIAELIAPDVQVDGFVFDIGVSSMQLDEGARGFSFSKEAPLDMRMSCDGISAKDLVNDLSEKDLADLIYNYGEERKSRVIAKKIADYRKHNPIETTTELASIIRTVVGGGKDIDPATKTFQALRIAVNDELGELERGLESAASLLDVGGRLVVVTFHSLEDRIVKNFFKEKSGKTPNASRYMPEVTKEKAVLSEVSKAIAPSKDELSANRRSRSAKLRYGVK